MSEPYCHGVLTCYEDLILSTTGHDIVGRQANSSVPPIMQPLSAIQASMNQHSISFVILVDARKYSVQVIDLTLVTPSDHLALQVPCEHIYAYDINHSLDIAVAIMLRDVFNHDGQRRTWWQLKQCPLSTHEPCDELEFATPNDQNLPPQCISCLGKAHSPSLEEGCKFIGFRWLHLDDTAHIGFVATVEEANRYVYHPWAPTHAAQHVAMLRFL
ncbi:uncharacterized protein LACBIDRAFT_322502 [Laccaria bicolor S238N-H82]|uniref:Predicted protein n=1 Tax=Laccaria bicolor (strain S238N-H82 / ATCC MYA-4686) TaxID=486041 RepID=B0CWI5_LACBS|nr:uncharacterized protein LACBIDRAFT_322502 [Laccaria bicolor S238N-H82]EDR13073.1 predicted protein [Laccaria bicolor S238N-H82]|eukprot:XP_001875571.1 predicted protein [Laccaria bicolor S238N-H82]